MNTFSNKWKIFEVDTSFNEDTLKLSVTGGRKFLEYKWWKMLEEEGPYRIGSVYRLSFCHPDNPDECAGYTINTEWSGRKEGVPAYFGELANSTGVMEIPPIPLTTLEPIKDEEFEVDVTIADATGSRPQLFRAQYKTIDVDIPWGNYNKTTRTALVEKPGGGTLPWHVYNYVWDKEKGLVAMWHSVLGEKGKLIVRME